MVRALQNNQKPKVSRPTEPISGSRSAAPIKHCLRVDVRSNYRQASTYTLTKATGSRVRAKDLRSDLAGFHKKVGSWFRVWAGI